ncbi:hypothetical protein CANTEDRAFT_115699 [Yamadazyma tenuis ATCC 10573]|uniref:Uncharacterized protein n=2 Tax=Candida tenuis TaxID=2315449 RepID=G3BBT6_CANTC|nr:uncharacterized protein CANTEDRAFT_115699 [Yamadazyma tenuis ATCC 10573]EGV62235.1 hypothetical protein CANTEDRAFT_115699 [Yamadazyma tenuis ATCC 10573]
MDHWGLGMVLFCIVYCGVPFSTSLVTDHGFREYKFNHSRFCGNNPGFKNNTDLHRGPGSEFKWASQFQSTGAARVAWKLCDPSIDHRYDLDLLFNDPWFQGLEMCVYEAEDQDVNPVVFPTVPSNASFSAVSTSAGSRVPSRRNTSLHNFNNASTAADLSSSFKSMLDFQSKEATNGQVHDNHEDGDDEDGDDKSIHSQSSLTHFHQAPPPLAADGCCSCEKPKSSSSMLDVVEKPKVKSMLDMAGSLNLPSLKEHDTYTENIKESKECVCDCHQEKSPANRPRAQSHPHPFRHVSSESLKRNSSQSSFTRNNSLTEWEDVLKPAEDLHLDSSGVCNLGYKIRKHHHLEVSGAAVSGALARRR